MLGQRPVNRFLPTTPAPHALCLCISWFAACADPPPCPDSLPPAFAITLTDMKTGANVCNGTILFTNDISGWKVSSNSPGMGNSCAYQSDAPIGTYTVTVTAPGYERTQRTGIVLTSDNCGIQGQTLAFSMVPAPDDGGPGDDGGSVPAEAGGSGDDGGDSTGD
jgi:hypothetical protein